MKKTILKFVLINILLAAGALIYIYAQKNFIRNNTRPKDKAQVEQDAQSENIGIQTTDDPWQEMDKLVAAYYNKEGVSYKGTIKVIDDNSDKEKIIEEKKFEYAAVDGEFSYKLGDIEVVSKSNLLLVTDHINKIISVSQHNPTKTKGTKFFDIQQFREVMEKGKAKAKVTQLGEEKMLTIENIIDPQVQGYRIYYDPKTYQINKILVGMMRFSPLSDDESGIDEMPGATDQKKQSNPETSDVDSQNEIDTYTYYIEMIYTETKLLKVTAKEFRPEDKFITKAKNRIELTPAFSKYQLLSNGNVINETAETKDEQE